MQSGFTASEIVKQYKFCLFCGRMRKNETGSALPGNLRKVIFGGFSCRAPGGARFQRVQVPNPPGSGKDIAEGKGVYREVESEGSWMWGTY